MSIFEEAKVDCHNHVLDPRRFPYARGVAYEPAGQEIGTRQQHQAVMDAYGMRHALLVGPNSGYGEDNRCLLDALAVSQGRFKGIAVVANDTPKERLQALQAQGVVGVAFNPTVHGLAYYLGDPKFTTLLRHLADLQMFAQLQVTDDQMVELAPPVLDSGAPMLIDHCGRPNPARGLQQPGFQAVLAMADSGRAAVKLSGLQKFCDDTWPYASALPYVQALIDAYTLDHCLWASDWPYLKATERVDLGPLLRWFEKLLPQAKDRQRLFWDTPCRLFGFDSQTATQ